MEAGWPLATTLIGGVCVLAIYSFLVKENSGYRLFEHLFIGISAGMGVVVGIRDFLWPRILEPLFGLDIVVYPDGTLSKEYNFWLILYLLPMAFGLLYYTLYSKKHAWMAKLVIGFSLGMSGGIAFKGFFNEITPQITKSLKPLLTWSPVAGEPGMYQLGIAFGNCLFVFTLLSVMVYFFFSFRATAESPTLRKVSHSGRWLMMVCFGAFFGSTVMARMALLVERIQFLLTDWWDAIVTLSKAVV
jgi:hypothetical protein